MDLFILITNLSNLSLHLILLKNNVLEIKLLHCV